MVTDINNPPELERLMLRVNARRVWSIYAMKGEEMPPGATNILEHDSEELQATDNEAYAVWCKKYGLECPLMVNGDYVLIQAAA